MDAERRRLVEDHIAITTSYARKRCWHGEDPSDVISDALYGLTLAARRFDPTRGAFAPTAFQSINAQITRGRQTRSGLSRSAWEDRRPRPMSLSAPAGEDATLEDWLEHPGREIDTALDRVAVRQALAVLPHHERVVVDLRYGREFSEVRVAGCIGRSQMQVSRLERSALGRLRAALEREAA